MSQNIDTIKWRMNMGAWVVLSVVMVAGGCASVAAMVFVMLRPELLLDKIAAPGESALELPKSGHHVLYYSFERTQDRRGVIRPDGYAGLDFTLSDPDGNTVSLSPAIEKYDYVLRYTRAKAVYAFYAAKPGTYTLKTEYPANAIGKPLTLALKSVNPDLLRDAFLATLAGLFATAILSSLVVFVGLKTYVPETA